MQALRSLSALRPAAPRPSLVVVAPQARHSHGSRVLPGPQLCPVHMQSMRAPVVVEAAASGGKQKTRKAAAKRFRVTGSGKVMARHNGKQHFNEKKSRKRVRQLGKSFVVCKGDIKNVVACLTNHGIGK